LIEQKEVALREEVLALSEVIPDPVPPNEGSRKALRIAAGYWSEFPFETDDASEDSQLQTLLSNALHNPSGYSSGAQAAPE
jgi:hypothetical protein